MRISKLWIERFQAATNLELVGLTDGVNVILGTSPSVTDSVRRFVTDCLNGEDESHSALSGTKQEPLNGRMTLVDAGGEHVIRCGVIRDPLMNERPARAPSVQVRETSGEPRPVKGWQGPRDVHAVDRRLFFGSPWNDELGLFIERTFTERSHDAAAREGTQRKIQQLQHDIEQTERAIGFREQELRRLAAEAEAAAQRAVRPENTELTWRNETLREIDARLQRWRDALAEIETRLRHLQSEIPANATSDHTGFWQTVTQNWMSLDQQLSNIRHSLDESQPADGCPHCHQRQMLQSLPRSLATLHDELKQLGTNLEQWHETGWSAEQLAERDQLLRCEMELRRTMDDELRRRTRLLAEITELQAAEAQRSQTANLRASDFVVARPETDEVLGGLHRRLAELRRDLLAAIEMLESSPLTVAASEWLEIVSHGRWRKVSQDGPLAIFVTDSANHTSQTNLLPPAQRRLIQMALWFALAEDFAARGVRWPVVLSEHWLEQTNVDAETAARAASRFSKHGQQMLCFVSHAEAAARFRRQGAVVFELSSPVYEGPRTPEPRPDLSKTVQGSSAASEPTPSRPSSAPDSSRMERRVFEPWSLERSRRERHYIRSRDWSAEEFPGELSDRVRLRDFGGEQPTTSQLHVASPTPSREPIHNLAGSANSSSRTPNFSAEPFSTIHSISPPTLSTDLASMSQALGATGLARELPMRPLSVTDSIDDFGGDDEPSRRSRRSSDSSTAGSSSAFSSSSTLHGSPSSGYSAHAVSHRNPASRTRDDRESERSHSTDRGDESREGRDERSASGERASRSDRPARRARARRYYLEAAAAIVDAPSIGPRMAERFEAIGIRTVAEFLLASPISTAEKLDNRRITADIIRQWQSQATLVLRVPDLRGHDAQMLVACDVTTPEQLATSNANELWQKVAQFAESIEGKRLLRNGTPPDLEEVQSWIASAIEAKSQHAA